MTKIDKIVRKNKYVRGPIYGSCHVCKEPMITNIEAPKWCTHLGAQAEGSLNTSRRLGKLESKSVSFLPIIIPKQPLK